MIARASLDFNQLIYLLGFPVMSFGLLLVAITPESPFTGCAFLTVGYAYVHLTMCGVNSYLAKQFGLPMPWVLSWTTCFFMLGQAGGVLIGLLVPAMGWSFAKSGTAVLFVLLVATIFLADNRNMRYGWGVVRPARAASSDGAVAMACDFVSAEGRLTDRESEVLVYLAAGRSRRFISGRLSVSEETVKTHVRSIYAKLGVHTKEDLISFVEERAAHFKDDAT